MTLSVVAFTCEKGPAYAVTDFFEFSSKYGKGPGCYSSLNYRARTTRLAPILYDALVEPISWKLRTWRKKIREKVVRTARENWGGATLEEFRAQVASNWEIQVAGDKLGILNA
jgi:hypothetical protein